MLLSRKKIPSQRASTPLFMDTLAPWIACFVLFALALITFCCSLYTILLFIFRPKNRTSFTGICTTRSVFHLCNAIIYGPYCGTITLLCFLFHYNISTAFSKICLISWYALTPIEAILSVKRQMAVRFPHAYRYVFSSTNVKYLMAGCTCSAFIFWLFRLYQGCFVYFHTESLHLEYVTKECEDFDVWIAKFFMIPLQIFSITVNFFTLYVILLARKKQSMNNLKKFKQRINYRLCIQLAIQNIFWLASTLCWLPQVEELLDHRLWKFFCRMGIPLTTHAIESIGFAALQLLAK